MSFQISRAAFRDGLRWLMAALRSTSRPAILCLDARYGRKLRTAHAVESGWVQVNQGGGQVPGMSHGGYKQSGIGREFSLEGMLDSFTQRKSVTVNLAI
jgi:acyl-CoA reductase-like NAD-dependent aldehyde dehydrogenase